MCTLAVINTLPGYFKCFLRSDQRWGFRSDLNTGTNGCLENQVQKLLLPLILFLLVHEIALISQTDI